MRSSGVASVRLRSTPRPSRPFSPYSDLPHEEFLTEKAVHVELPVPGNPRPGPRPRPARRRRGTEPGHAGVAPAAAPVTVAAVRISAVPIVDGSLSDAAWAGLQPLSGFIQRVPRDGEPATLQTEVRIGHDDAALYVGIRAHDDRPELIVPGDRIRDYDLSQSDALVLILDTYHDGVNGFVFGTNPAGIEYDGQVVDQGSGGGGGGGGGGLRGGGIGPGRQQGGSGDGFNLNWDGSWEVASSRDAGGWSAEFRIPFSTLRYRAGTRQDWGFNVLRRVRRGERGVILVAHPARVRSLPGERGRHAGRSRATGRALGAGDAVSLGLLRPQLRRG